MEKPKILLFDLDMIAEANLQETAEKVMTQNLNPLKAKSKGMVVLLKRHKNNII